MPNVWTDELYGLFNLDDAVGGYAGGEPQP
jgi:hypothetical protein